MKRFAQFVGDESGHTLIETVAAMAIFLGVLIPCVMTIGNLLLDRNVDDLNESLRIAEGMMSSVRSGGWLPENQEIVIDRYLVRTSVEREEMIATVKISVWRTLKPDRKILELQKSFLEYE